MSRDPRPGLCQRLGDVLLTTEPTHRIRLMQAGFATLLMALSAGVLIYAARMGDIPGGLVAGWALLSLGGFAAAFVAIRIGWSRRLADPPMTLAQMVFAITVGAAAFAMAGPVHGATLPVLFVILMFGMFRLSARTLALVGLYAAGLFGAVMALMDWWRPQVYVPGVELGHFMMLAAMLPVISLLAAQLAGLRERHRKHRDELASAVARIQELATRDELTGLINRRHMAELLEQERQRCARSGRSFCVALLDVDHFKSINDRHGHAAGDEVLRQFAREALAAIRVGDVLSRCGGEEFVLLLLDSRLPPARGGVERLRQRIKAANLLGSDPPLRVTLSAGLTEHIAGEAISDALARAEQALYAAKAEGRNRTVVAGRGTVAS